MEAIERNQEDEKLQTKRARYRVCVVSGRLTEDEFRRFSELAESRQECQADVIRSLILQELERAKNGGDPVLVEVVGVRLLVINLLHGLVCGKVSMTEQIFDQIVDQIRDSKRTLASELVAAERAK